MRTFPDIYPDEMLYSVLGRYARNIGGGSPAAIAFDLFGHRTAIASFDLPGGLSALVERLPRARALSVDDLIDRTTLFSYETAFCSAETRSDVAQAMAGSTSGYHLRLGIAAFTIERTTTLRFCPACREAMIAAHGEPYWRRTHQLPGALVCPDHAKPLRLSRVSCQTTNRHAYLVADDLACPTASMPVVRALDSTTLLRLVEVAKASQSLLDHPPAPMSLAEIGPRYRRRVEAAGFMRSRRRVDQARLLEAFRAHFGRALELLPVGDPGSGDEGWLAALTRKQRKAAHPLRHILLNLFLKAQGAAQEAPDAPPAAFGGGPWLCRNPLVEHHGKPVVKDLTWYRNRDAVVGVFRCCCGYTYTRGVDRSGRLGPPRYRAFGPSLERPLEDWIAQGLTLRGIARQLQLDPKTVAAEADKLGLITPWTCSSVKPKALPGDTQGGTTEADDGEVQARPACRKSPCPRRDWSALDRELVVRLRHLDAVIRREWTPVRASVAEFERRLGRRGWLRKRRRILPDANAFLDAHQETIPEFQRRRLEWVIRSRSPDDPPAAWRACAIAGLGPDWLPVAERILAENLTDHHRIRGLCGP